MKKIFALVIALVMSFQPAEAGWKLKAAGLALGVGARRAPAICLRSPACASAVERGLLALAARYGTAAAATCLKSPSCLEALLGGAVAGGSVSGFNAVEEHLASNMGKGSKRAHREAGANPPTSSPNQSSPDPDDEQEPEDTGPVTTLQTGGRTVEDRTAAKLNQRFGTRYNGRQWGRALEKLKSKEGLRNDHHGKIMSDGSYRNDAGRIIGNIRDHVR